MSTKEELQERAAELNVEGRSSMTKDELESAIAKADGSKTAGPSESELTNSLDAWWAEQVAAGATAEDLDAALGSFEPKGPVGLIERKTVTQAGHYSVSVEPSEA